MSSLARNSRELRQSLSTKKPEMPGYSLQIRGKTWSVDVVPIPNSDQVTEFCKTRLTNRFEAMVLLGRADYLLRLLQSLELWVAHQDNLELTHLISDAQSFLRNFLYLLRDSPLQVYGTAIGFCRANSKMRQYFHNSMLPHILATGGGKGEWSSIITKISKHGPNSSSIHCAAYAPDDRKLAIYWAYDSVSIWGTDEGDLKQELSFLTRLIPAYSNLIFSQGGDLLAGESINRSRVCPGHDVLWNLVNGSTTCLEPKKRRPRTNYEHTRRLKRIAISPNDCFWASIVDVRSIQLCNIQTGQSRLLETTVGCDTDDELFALEFVQVGEVLTAVSLALNFLSCWSVETGVLTTVSVMHGNSRKTIKVLSAKGMLLYRHHTDHRETELVVCDLRMGTYSLKPDPHGQVNFGDDAVFVDIDTVAYKSSSSLSVWNFQTSKCCWSKFLKDSDEPQLAVTIESSDNGKLIATSILSLEDRTIDVLDALTGQLLQRLPIPGGVLWSIMFSPNNMTLASVYGREVNIWRFTPSETIVHEIDASLEVTRLKFAPNFRTIVSLERHTLVKDGRIGRDQWRLRCWECSTTKICTEGMWKYELNDFANIGSFWFSQDSGFIIFITSDGLLQIIDAKSGRWMSDITLRRESPDERMVGLGFSHKTMILLSPRRMKIWNTTKSTFTPTLDETYPQVDAVALHTPAGGNYYGVLRYNDIDIWDINVGQKLYSVPWIAETINPEHVDARSSAPSNRVDFSRHGSRLACISDGAIYTEYGVSYTCAVKLVNVQSGALLSVFQSSDPLEFFQFDRPVRRSFCSTGKYLILGNLPIPLVIDFSDDGQGRFNPRFLKAPEIEVLSATEKWMDISRDGWISIGGKPMFFLPPEYSDDTVAVEEEAGLVAVWYPAQCRPTIIQFDRSKVQ